MTQNFEYIDSDAELVRVVDICRQRSVVSVDTEFARTNTYYPEIGLVQVYDGEHCYIIDPLAMSSLAPLATLLSDPDVLKVFHSCSEDLEVFQYAAGIVPSPVFDSQIAAAILGVGFSVSYQNLVQHHLGHTIPKEETRSNWLQRPLSAAQLDYAALDVIYLLEVYLQQTEQLSGLGRLTWLEEECQLLGSEIATSMNPDEFYLRARSAARMNRAELNVFRALCAWREKLARTMNVPRNRVVDEKALVAVSRGAIRTKAALQEVTEITPRQLRKHGDEMLAVVAAALETPAQGFPAALEDSRTPNITNEQLKLLRKVVTERAEALNVAPEILAKRRQLEQLLRSGGDSGDYTLPLALSGWRAEVVGQHLLDALLAVRPVAGKA